MLTGILGKMWRDGDWDTGAGQFFADPWAARDGYIALILDRRPDAASTFLAEHAGFRPTYAGLALILVVVALLAARAADADARKVLAPAAAQAA